MAYVRADRRAPAQSAARKAYVRAAKLGSGGPVTLANPIAGRFPTLYQFTRTASAVYATNFSVEDFAAPANARTLYVAQTGGSNSNDGLTPATALATLAGLTGKVQAGDNVEIINLTSDWIIRNGWIASPGFPVLFSLRNRSTQYRLIIPGSSGTVHTWSANGTFANVAQAAATSASGVVDCTLKARNFRLDSGGSGYAVNDTITLNNGAVIRVLGVDGGAVRVWEYVLSPYLTVTATAATATSGSGTGITFVTAAADEPLMFATARRVTSLADCAAQRGTWFNDGTNTYLNPHDARTVTGSQVGIVIGSVSINGANQNTSLAGTMFIEGIDFILGQTPFASSFAGTTNRPNLAFSRCTFQGGRNNGLGLLAYWQVWADRCGAYFNGQDGWNLHNNGGPTQLGSSPTMLGTRIGAHGNGTINSTAASTSDNDFTLHEECSAILINAMLGGSDDRVLGNIDDTRIWMLGGYIGSAKTAMTGSFASTVDLTITAQAYLDGVTVGAVPASATAQTFNVGTGATLFYRNMTPVPTTTGAGSVAAY